MVLTSLIFATMHFRVETPQLSPEPLVYLVVGNAAASLATAAFAVALVRWRTGATARDKVCQAFLWRRGSRPDCHGQP